MPENTTQLALISKPHTATDDTQVSTLPDEQVEVLPDPATEGFTKITTREGKVGLVPTCTLEFITKPPPKSSAESRIVVAVYDYKGDDTELSFQGMWVCADGSRRRD